jgi:hypothetical protein
MTSNAIAGSCLCGAIRFEVDPPFAAFRYCHCSRCRKASGSAHAANMFVPETQFRWRAGQSQVQRFDLPEAKRFAVCFCPRCGTRVPHKIATTENVLIPAGVLDADPGMRPENSIFWKSKAAWYVAPAEMPVHDEYG